MLKFLAQDVGARVAQALCPLEESEEDLEACCIATARAFESAPTFTVTLLGEGVDVRKLDAESSKRITITASEVYCPMCLSIPPPQSILPPTECSKECCQFETHRQNRYSYNIYYKYSTTHYIPTSSPH